MSLPLEARDAAMTGFAGWRRILWLDRALLVWVRQREHAALTHTMLALTRLGDVASWVLLALVLATRGADGPTLATRLTVAAILALAASQGLKRLCCRPRPGSLAPAGRRLAPLAADPDAFSFPSGHTAVAFAVAVALAGAGPALGAVTLGLACGIAVSRVYLGAHYPLDVAAGAALGAVCGRVAPLALLALSPG